MAITYDLRPVALARGETVRYAGYIMRDGVKVPCECKPSTRKPGNVLVTYGVYDEVTSDPLEGTKVKKHRLCQAVVSESEIVR